MADLLALIFWLALFAVISHEWRGDRQARRDAASIREWERARRGRR